MTIRQNLLACLLLSCWLCGCGLAKFAYRGDGDFLVNSSYSMPYTIDLGYIDIAQPASHHYKMGNLPIKRFYIGLQITDDIVNGVETTRDYPVVVRVVLKDEKGGTVIDEKAELTDWIRSYAVGGKHLFFYRRGRSIDVVNGGSTVSKKIGLKASQGWGTSFVARRGEDYSLEVAVLSSAINLPTRVIVR